MAMLCTVRVRTWEVDHKSDTMFLREVRPTGRSYRRLFAFLPRWFATSVSDTPQPKVFDRELKFRQRDLSFQGEESEYYDYLRQEVSARLVDRLDDITRAFPNALEIGSHRGHFLKRLLKESEYREDVCGGIETLTQLDSSQHAFDEMDAYSKLQKSVDIKALCGDEERIGSLFAEDSFDLVVSSMAMHWVNDVPGVLNSICKVLKPDGCFLGVMLGGNTLKELRYCLYLAEQERKGGISPHTSPFAGASDISSLVHAAGFQIQTVDVDTVQIGYPNMFILMEHLQRMGEGNASIGRQYNVGRDTFLSAAAIYQKLYGMEDGTIPATFQVMYMIGWKHHDSQPKPKRRGSQEKPIPGKINRG